MYKRCTDIIERTYKNMLVKRVVITYITNIEEYWLYHDEDGD